MKLRFLLPLFLCIAILMSALTGWLAIKLKASLDEVADAQERRFLSVSLADELRQSSDDLTNFARMFVQTEDQRFEKYFQQVLKIRNGEAPRPEGYEGIYWDRVIAENNSLFETETGEIISFEDRMVQLGFTESELALLHESQRQSDKLATIENQAFDALKGYKKGAFSAGQGFQDDGGGNFFFSSDFGAALAQSLLYGDDYFQVKAAIMEPIGRFQDQVNFRTKQSLEAVQNNARSLLFGVLFATASLFGTLVILSLIIQRKVLLRTNILAGTAQQITEGDLTVRSRIQGNDELGILGKTFDNMVSQLSQTLILVNAAKDRMEKELNVAHEIQMSMLPLIFPPFPDHKEFDIYAELHPAREVGGDFYDFYILDDEWFSFIIADVSGKGVPAALFMAVSKTLIKSHAMSARSTASIMTNVNNELSADNKESMLVTVFMAMFNFTTGEMIYTNAGHNPPFIKRANGSVEQLNERHGPVVGAMGGLIYKEGTLKLAKDDIVLLYTDGVTEAQDSNNRLYGDNALHQLIEQEETKDIKSIIKNILLSVKEHEVGTGQSDDITLLGFKVTQEIYPENLDTLELTLKNDISEITRLIDSLEDFAKKNNLPTAIIRKFSMACDEIVSNYIYYGSPHQIDDTLHVKLTKLKNKLIVQISDPGIPFNPLQDAKDADTVSSIEDRKLGGLGIHLVKEIIDEVSYKRQNNRNILILSGYLPDKKR
ncbi:MAG: SpoIIE family protein phosphatase [Gammaproteobacteria bacterium]|nr:SpoIIE family protein phosphatase [Gammaproteobacteria bacterium]